MEIEDLELNGPLYLYVPEDRFTPLQFRIGPCTKVTRTYAWFDTRHRLSRAEVKKVQKLTDEETLMYKGLIISRLGTLPSQLRNIVELGERLERLLTTEPFAQVNGERFTRALNELSDGLEELGRVIKVNNSIYEVEYDPRDKKAPMVRLVMKGEGD